jgi:hypothetical protein
MKENKDELVISEERWEIYGDMWDYLITNVFLQNFFSPSFFIFTPPLLTSNECRGQENVGLYIHSPIRLHGVVLN